MRLGVVIVLAVLGVGGIAWAVFVAGKGAPAMHGSAPQAAAALPAPATVALPTPATEGAVSVEQALCRRRSVRSYADSALKLREVGQLLWAAQGITDPRRGFRTAPSAGALYPLEVYLVAGKVEGLAQGVYRYGPQGHSLSLWQSGDVRSSLCSAAYDQDQIRAAPALLCITAVYGRTRAKYGAKAERFAQIETGHAGQNVCLQAVALGLASCVTGGFDDGQVSAVLRLPEGEAPLVIIPVGRPRT